MAPDVDAVPNGITPQYNSAGCQVGEIATQAQHTRAKHTRPTPEIQFESE
jgi:hypothetical protein